MELLLEKRTAIIIFMLSLSLLFIFMPVIAFSECAHEHNMYDFSELNTQATYIDSLKHSIVTDLQITKLCLDCGVRTDIVETGITYIEGHHYGDPAEWEDEEIARCICGNVCDHKGNISTDTSYRLINGTANAIDNQFHEGQYRCRITTFCGFCQKQISSNTTTTSMTQYHYFSPNTNLCACGMENPCKHEDQYVYTLWENVCFVSVDEEYHTSHQVQIQNYLCKTCGTLVKSEENSETTRNLKEKHQTNRYGYCNDCGIKVNCIHSNTEEIHRHSYFPTGYESVNENGHYCTALEIIETYCVDCGICLGPKSINSSIPIFDKHFYKETLQCNSCGYLLNSCDHILEVKQTSDGNSFDFSFKNVTASSHTRLIETCYGSICTKCGTRYGFRYILSGTKKWVTEPHDVLNGRCKYCNYEEPILPPAGVPDGSDEGDLLPEDTDFDNLPPVKVPTLILPDGTIEELDLTLKFNGPIKEGKNNIKYDVRLVDSEGNKVELPKECILCFPYPEGLDETSENRYRIMIHHLGDKGMEKFSTEDDTIDLKPQGLCIRISSLSPFIIEWEEQPEVVLPQTGDNSHIALWLALLMLAGTATLILNRKTA